MAKNHYVPKLILKKFSNSNNGRICIYNVKTGELLENVNCKVDVILTHEPSGIIKDFLKLGDNESIHVTSLNAYFDELSKCADFERWFFGSLHLDKYISTSYIGVHKAIINAHTGERVKF